MNRLELAQEIYEKQQKLSNNLIIQGHQICIHFGIIGGLTFSVWPQGTDSAEAPRFNEDLVLISGHGYKEIIDEAKAALKEFLEGEV
jgi:hypothetical protein